MFNLLFVNSCHPLSACISTLHNKCKNMSDSERAMVKDRISPKERLVLLICNFLTIFLDDDKVLIKFPSDHSSELLHLMWS